MSGRQGAQQKIRTAPTLRSRLVVVTLAFCLEDVSSRFIQMCIQGSTDADLKVLKSDVWTEQRKNGFRSSSSSCLSYA